MVTVHDWNDGVPHWDRYDLAIDPAGRLWMSGASGWTVLDPRGTPTDKSDDVWRSRPFRSESDAYHDATFVDGEVRWARTLRGVVRIAPNDPADPVDDVEDLRGDTLGAWDRNLRRIVVDDAGLVWLAGYRALTVVDTAGTPLDSSDDRRAHFFPAPRIDSIALDRRGGLYVSAYDDPLVYLDLGGTPFDPGDDRTLSFEYRDGLGLRLRGMTEMVFADDRLFAVMQFGELDPPFTYVLHGLIVLDPGSDPLSESDDEWRSIELANSGLGGAPVRAMARLPSGVMFFVHDAGVSVLGANADPWVPQNWTEIAGSFPQARAIVANERGAAVSGFPFLTYIDFGGSPTDGVGDAVVPQTASPHAFSSYRALSYDRGGRLWFGGYGRAEPDAPILVVHDDGDRVLSTSDDQSWVVRRNEPALLGSEQVAVIATNPDCSAWVSTGTGLFYVELTR